MRRASALLERLAAPPVRTTQERYRHELKYLINEGEHSALACRMAPVFKLDKHARAGGYTIRSLYFDDYCNSAYEEKDAGILMRKKYRVRIYNGSDKVIKLERKKKFGSWIYKEDAPLTRGEFEQILAGDYDFLLRSPYPLCREFYIECICNMMRPRTIVDLGIMSALNFMASNGFIALDTNNFIYKIADLVSGTSFGILQILIGYSAAKAFGANPYLGAVVGGAFINSSLQSAYTVASEGVQTMVTVIPGVYSFEWIGYQGHVIPIVIACAILAFLEKRLHKVVPEMFDLFVTPLVSVFVTVLVTLVAVGPIFVWAENAILGLIQALLTLPFGIGSFIVGLFYAPTVVTGIHQMYTAIDLGQLAQYGVTYWLPIASAANIAQGGAALAVAFKTRDAKIKGLALPSALSAFMGITEPAIFGVNLRFFKPFIAGCIGGGCGALVCALTSLAASGTGVTGIFGILLCLAQPVQYAIMFAVAALVSFAVSFVLYKDEPKASEQA